jgi:hypothetical protein
MTNQFCHDTVLSDAQLDDVSGGLTALEGVWVAAAASAAYAAGTYVAKEAGSNAAQGAARGVLAAAAG